MSVKKTQNTFPMSLKKVGKLCKLCKKRKTDTIICEKCWDRIQILKIRKEWL